MTGKCVAAAPAASCLTTKTHWLSCQPLSSGTKQIMAANGVPYPTPATANGPTFFHKSQSAGMFLPLPVAGIVAAVLCSYIDAHFPAAKRERERDPEFFFFGSPCSCCLSPSIHSSICVVGRPENKSATLSHNRPD